MTRALRVFAVPVVVVLLIAGAPTAAPASPAGTVTVFAAASLTESFSALAKVFERRNTNTRVTFNFAGSHSLATQLEHGARAAAYTSAADDLWMEHVRRRGLIAGVPSEFARNRLVVIIPRTNPARITRLQGLADRGVKVVLAAGAAPAGRYSREALRKLSRAPTFPADYAGRVLRNVVSEEESVRGVVAKVVLGEADAGIVYLTDVTRPSGDRVRILQIPEPYNVVATYPIAALRDASNSDGAGKFVAHVLSPLGQRVLKEHGFLPVVNP